MWLSWCWLGYLTISSYVLLERVFRSKPTLGLVYDDTVQTNIKLRNTLNEMMDQKSQNVPFVLLPGYIAVNMKIYNENNELIYFTRSRRILNSILTAQFLVFSLSSPLFIYDFLAPAAWSARSLSLTSTSYLW